MNAGVKTSCAKQWKNLLDVNDQWMVLNYNADKSKVTSIKCKLCEKHESRLKYTRNFSRALISGISGSSLKKDALVKHNRAEQHTKAEAYERSPMSREDFYKQTPFGKYNLHE